MDYEKKYNEALERARKIHNEILDNEILGFPDQIREIFPELRESEDERMYKAICSIISEHYDRLMSYQVCRERKAEFVKERDKILIYLEKQKEQKSTWSEEDEKIIDTIVSVLGQYIDYKAVSGTGSGYATPRYTKEIDWLKSISPQPKQEWSEEDENIINNICDYLLGVLRFSDVAKEKAIVFLHSLRPLKGWKEGWCEDCKVRYNHWKPSKEQMDALKDIAYGTYQNGDGPTLRELYEQLKKLM